jgi:hypothetical protein
MEQEICAREDVAIRGYEVGTGPDNTAREHNREAYRYWYLSGPRSHGMCAWGMLEAAHH